MGEPDRKTAEEKTREITRMHPLTGDTPRTAMAALNQTIGSSRRLREVEEAVAGLLRAYDEAVEKLPAMQEKFGG